MSRFQAASLSPSGAGTEERVTPEEEASTIAGLMEHPLVKGEFWYVISCEWWRDWSSYVGFDSIREQLKSIRKEGGAGAVHEAMANLSLSATSPAASPQRGASGKKVEDGEESQGDALASSSTTSKLQSPSSGIRPYRIDNRPLIGETNRDLDKRISQNEHFLLLPKDAWEKLVGWYGGGPAIPRKVVSQGENQSLIVELYPCKFLVVRADVDGNPIQIEQSDLADPSSGDYQCLYFNRDVTTADIMSEVCAAFQTFKHSSRLWVSQTLDSDKWRLVGSKDSVSDLCDAGESACLMLECKSQETGAYPRDMAVVKAAWRDDIKAGDKLDAQDHDQNTWYEAIVKERDGNKIRVHFMGWLPKFDEDFDIELEPARLMPLNTKVKFWRDFRVNDIIEMRRYRDMQALTGTFDWKLVKIDSVDREKKELTVYFKEDPPKDRKKYRVSFDSEEIMWKGCHTKKSYWDIRNNKQLSEGDTMGVPRGGAGVVGLQNLGNTCFMNSMLQCLSNCETLTKHFLDGDFQDNLNTDNPLGMGGRMAECYANLMQRMWSGEVTVCRPSSIKKLIGEKAPHFQGYQQQDSSELMNYLLDGLHEDLNLVNKKPYVEEKEAEGRPDQVVAAERWEGFKKRNDSFIVDNFFGLVRSEVRCDHPDCSRVSVTFDPVRAFMLPLPAVVDMMVKVTFIYVDPSKPVTMYGVSVPKTGKADSVRAWLQNETGVEAKNIFLCNYSHYQKKIASMVDLSEVNSNAYGKDYYKIYAYEVRPESDFENESDLNNVEKDLNGYYVGMKCKCRFNEMRIRHYNCTVTAIHKDPDGDKAKYTYDVLFEDGDVNKDVPLERMDTSRVPEQYSSYYRQKPNLMQIAFRGESTEGRDGRIVVEMVHRIPKTQSVYSHTPVGSLIQWPLLLSMKRIISGDELHNLIWQQVNRFVIPDAGWNRHNLPYVLRKGDAIRTGIEIEDSQEPLSFKENEVIIVDWSSEGNKSGFDESSIERREYHESMPGHEDGSRNTGLSVNKCFEVFKKEEQLGTNDTWHCSECRTNGREPFRQAFKKMTVYRTGEILVLHLKRFVFEAGFSASFVHREKISTPVDYPVEGLDLTGIVQQPNAPHEPNRPLIYDLFAVSNHMGGLGGGHYTAYAKNFQSGKWYLFNDSSTHEVEPSEVVTPEAYVLFYKRRPLGSDNSSRTGK